MTVIAKAVRNPTKAFVAGVILVNIPTLYHSLKRLVNQKGTIPKRAGLRRGVKGVR